MNCLEVKELLSAYYDDELSSDKRTALAEHLAGCDDCTHQLRGFRRLSAMANRLTHPEPPTQLWHQIEDQLDLEHAADPELSGFFAWMGWTRYPAVRFGLATAAAILIAVVWFGYRTSLEHGGDHQMAAVFGEYLEEFRRDPDAAQQILLANYESQIVDAEQAVQTVRYRPAVAGGMPAGYSVESTYVMKMPCCKCVQCICKRRDGTTIAIFEHDDEEPDWFGDRPTTKAICNGTRCRLVELDDRIAASWKRGKRYITVIGVRDTAEVDQLVAWFDDRRQIGPR
jgi:hypothetical protein